MQSSAILSPDFVWVIIKLITLFGFLVYIVFAFIVVKQVKLMTDTLELGLEREIKILSYVHLFVAITVFIVAAFAS